MTDYALENRFKLNFAKDEFKDLHRSIINSNLPGINLGTIIHQTPIKPLFLPGDTIEFNQLTVNFSLEEDYANYITILKWILTNKNSQQLDSEIKVTDVSMDILNNKFNPIFGIKLEDVFPINLSDIDYNVTNSDIQVPTFSVSFVVNNMELDLTV
jgi:hypothetical protein